jgi:hypothetical protein
VKIDPETPVVTTSPSISGDLFAVVGTQTGQVCARQLDGDTPPDSGPPGWQAGCLDVTPGHPIASSPVIDSGGRVYVVSNSILYEIR